MHLNSNYAKVVRENDLNGLALVFGDADQLKLLFPMTLGQWTAFRLRFWGFPSVHRQTSSPSPCLRQHHLYCTRAVQKCPIVHKHCTYIIVIAWENVLNTTVMTTLFWPNICSGDKQISIHASLGNHPDITVYVTLPVQNGLPMLVDMAHVFICPG